MEIGEESGAVVALGDLSLGCRPGRIVVGVYNVVRFAVGTLLAPLRVVQAWSGRGEEIELLARKPERV